MKLEDLVNIENINLTSRSAIERGQRCNRARFLEHHYDGIGIRPSLRNVPLVTGTAIHKGVEVLTTAAKKKLPEDMEGLIDEAVLEAIKAYKEEVGNRGFSGKGVDTDERQEFTLNEQIALTEALVRAWALRELPILVKRFKILEVEREENEWLIPGSIVMQGRVDAILKERENGDIYCYSLKSTREWNDRVEKSYGVDLQGITETWITEERLKRESKKILKLIEDLKATEGVRKKSAIIEILENSLPQTRISGVKFCFLVKGARYEDKDSQGRGTGQYRTHSPLIRGYRNIGPNDVKYAFSWFYPNSSNKSGKGALGKGWEGINAWEIKGGIKKWIEMLDNGEIQPECGDVIKASVVTPTEYFRNQKEIDDTLDELVASEVEWFNKLDNFNDDRFNINKLFPKNRQSCFYPYDCDYERICHKGLDIDEALEDGSFEYRVPHHELEAGKIALLKKKLEERKGNGESSESNKNDEDGNDSLEETD